MRGGLRLSRRACLTAGAALLPGCRERPELVVFHASSLSRAFFELGELVQVGSPRLSIRAEPSGSQVAARKVSELGMRADLVATADVAILERLMVPEHAAFSLEFATNELVLAHRDHSRFTDLVSAENWPEVLLRPGVRLGRVDPDLAPLGYHTLVAWTLAGQGLAERLAGACAPEHVAPDEAELVAQLEARAIEYAFVYRSTAEDHRLKLVELPPELNLSRRDLAPHYAKASVEVRMKLVGPRVRLAGSPVVYGLAIPRRAKNPEAARRFVTTLLSAKGRGVLERAGLHPLFPALSTRPEAVPGELTGLVERSP
ncbi:MAG: substrate-binding domain-containing protein [Myxococcaceae bacterium]